MSCPGFLVFCWQSFVESTALRHARSMVQLSPMLVKVHRSTRLSCNAGHQEISRCHTRGESEDNTCENACKQIIHPGFEICGRRHKKSKTGVSFAQQKWLVFKKFDQQCALCELSVHVSWLLSNKKTVKKARPSRSWKTLSKSFVDNYCHSSFICG